MRAPSSLFTSVVDRHSAPPGSDDFTPPLQPHERVRGVAVLVAHGMGQQLRYETLSAVVDVVRRGQKLLAQQESKVGAYLVPWEGDFIARAEMRLRGADGTPHFVHVYEAYWAPLAVGRISTLETFRFLVAAGLRGQRRSSHGAFDRYMFGKWNALPLGRLMRISLLLASVLLLLLGAMNAVVLSAAASRAIAGGASRWMSVALLQDLTIDFGLFVASAAVLLLLGLKVPEAVRARLRARGNGGAVPGALSGAGMAFVYAALVVTFLAGLLVIAHVASAGLGRHWLTWAGTPLYSMVAGLADRRGSGAQWIWAFAVWGSVLLLSSRVRYFLREYVGDVAIYVSSNSLNRYSETRKAIQKVVGDVARCVYSQTDEPPPGAGGAKGAPLYDRVVVVGHSLGSVVAYDVLNEMLRDEIYGHQFGLGVRERTHALITFGSPLDKTAFIFRQQTKEDTPLRETFAAAWQPLIRKYRYRPPRWINLYSKMDWISGRLVYYDRVTEPDRGARSGAGIAPPPGREDDPALEAARRVINREDPGASTPLAAHSEYWEGEMLARTLFEEITCADPEPLSGS